MARDQIVTVNINFAKEYGMSAARMIEVLAREIAHPRCRCIVESSFGWEEKMKTVVLQVDSLEGEQSLVSTIERVIENNQKRISDFIDQLKAVVAEETDHIIEAAMEGQKVMIYDPMQMQELTPATEEKHKVLLKIEAARKRIAEGTRLVDALGMWGEPTIELTVEEFDTLVRDEW